MPYADKEVAKVYHREYMREYTKTHTQTYTPSQREQKNLRQRQTYNPQAKRGYHLKNRYGMSDGEYSALLAAQGGHCKLCSRTIEANGHPLAVDHDKVTGKVRGILCRNHNQSLGGLGDNEAGLLEALAYVRGEL